MNRAEVPRMARSKAVDLEHKTESLLTSQIRALEFNASGVALKEILVVLPRAIEEQAGGQSIASIFPRTIPTGSSEASRSSSAALRVHTQLISDLLDISRIVSGKLRLDVQRGELPAVIDAAPAGDVLNAASAQREVVTVTQ
jgi:hypothetical protein